MLDEIEIEAYKKIKNNIEKYNIEAFKEEFSSNIVKSVIYSNYSRSLEIIDLLLTNKTDVIFSLVTHQIIQFALNEFVSYLDKLSDLDKREYDLSRKDEVILIDVDNRISAVNIFVRNVFEIYKKEISIEERNKELDNNYKKLLLRVPLEEVRRKSLDNSLRESQQLYRSLEQQVEELRNTNSEILESARLVTQSAMFNEAAEKNNKEANFWIAMIFVSVGVFIWLIFHLMNNFCFDMGCYLPEDLKKYNAICDTCGQSVLWLEISKSMVFRLLLISFNLYVVTFCVKNYNASMHNKTINRHRNNSFAVAFHLFNNTTSKNKDEILSKAADSIFQYQKTGYYGKDNQPISPNVIQSIFDKLSSK